MRVELAFDANVKYHQKLYEGQHVTTEKDGYVKLELYPYKSIRAEVWPCTDAGIDQLQRIGNAIALRFSYKDRLFCPYRAYLKITSTLVDKNSQVKMGAKGREIVLFGTQMAVSQSIDGSLMLGVNKGVVEVSYLGLEPRRVEAGYFIRSQDGQPVSEPIRAELPQLKYAIALGNGRYRMCTNPDNQIDGQNYLTRISGIDLLCSDARLGDALEIRSPTGDSIRVMPCPVGAAKNGYPVASHISSIQ